MSHSSEVQHSTSAPGKVGLIMKADKKHDKKVATVKVMGYPLINFVGANV